LILARKSKDPLIAGTPDIAGTARNAAEPKAIANALHAEQLESAIRAAKWLHGNDKPFTLGLILVLQTQLRTNLVRANIQASLFGSGVDILTSGSILEAELSDADDDEIYLGLFGGYREGGLAEDVVGPITDLESVVLKGLTKIVGGLEAVRAELDGFPDPELGSWRTETREELLESFWVLNPTLHDGLGHIGEILSNTSNQLSNLIRHGGFSFQGFHHLLVKRQRDTLYLTNMDNTSNIYICQ